MAMTQLVSDSFNQYVGFPVNLTAGNWSKFFGAANPMEVPSLSAAANSAGGDAGCAAIWTGPVPNPSNSWPNDQYAEITFPAAGRADFTDVHVRGSLVANTRAVLELIPGSTQSLYIIVAGSILHQYTFTATLAVSDVWRVSVTGTTYTITQNGVTRFTQVDGNILSGNPGFGAESSAVGTVAIIKFAAGAIQTAPPTFTPIGLTYINTGTTQQVTVSDATVGATIYYTTDGTTPTTGSPTVVSGSNVTVTYPCQLQAMASLSGNNSLVSSYSFKVPTFGYGTLLATDNFASGSISSNWIAVGSSFPQVTGSPKVTEAPALGYVSTIQYGGFNWPNDQISEVTVNTLTAEASTQLSLSTRAQGTNGPGGYVILIKNGTASFIEETLAGVDTILTTASVTISAGDVLTLESRGASHAFYQNGTHIFHVASVAVMSGTPGYGLYSTSNLAHASVSSWRGYSCVQQDGTWQKQGVIIAPLAVDLAGAQGGQGIQVASIFQDTNPQILPGPIVFKSWLISGWAGATANLYYAESADGLNWTRQGSSVLTGYTNNVVDKVGSTYYMRCQTAAGNGAPGVIGTMQVFTSSDGINWNLQSPSQTVYGGSAGATWDNDSFYPGSLIDIVGGTWYVSYLGSGGALPGSLFSTGLMTSTDGINFVKQSISGPILQSALPQVFNLINGTYYGWFQKGEGGQGNGSLDPIEIIRYQSTNRVNWTNPVKSMHHSCMGEGMNFNHGYVIAAGGRAFNFNNQGVLYLNIGDGDNIPPQIGQLAISIANQPLSTIVLSDEDGVNQTSTDAFPIAGALPSNWTIPTGAGVPKILSAGVVEPTLTNTQSVAVFTGGSFTTSQYSDITLLSLASSGNDFTSPIVYATPAAQTYYEALMTATMGSQGTIQINIVVGGVATPIGPAVAMTPNIGDVIRLAVISTPQGNVLQVFQNKFMLINGLDTLNTITSGSPGFALKGAAIAGAQISAWAGGNVTSIPAPPPSGCNAYSVPDCRNYFIYPNTAILTNCTKIYTGQTSSNPAVPGVDCRAAGAPIASGTYPQNSRTPGLYGPGE